MADSSYPNRPITIIIAYPPGAATDAVARLVAGKISASMGQPVVVESKPGASGNLGTGFVARAAPDGYTILMSPDNPITTNIHLFKALGYDPVKDFAPITIAASSVICIVGAKTFAPNSLGEVIEYAKAKPGSVTYGTPGIGTPHHLIGESIRQRVNIDIQHAPYRGGGPALNDVLGGHTQLAILSFSAAMSFVGTDALKIYAISEPTRYSSIPNIPTISETLAGFSLSPWLGFLAPAATPKDIIARLNKEITEALKQPDVKQRLVALGLTPIGSSSETAKTLILKDLKIRGDLVQSAKIEKVQ